MSDKELRDLIRLAKDAIDSSANKEEAVRRLRELQESLGLQKDGDERPE